VTARRVLVAVVLGSAVAVAGCTGGPAGGPATGPEGATGTGSPLAGCAALAVPPPRAAPGRDGPAGGSSPLPAVTLPAVTLPCFTGGEPVAVADLAGPAVVNFWASWCPPCRDELPALQRFAGQTSGRVHVVGVVTMDNRETAAALATDTGATFPALYDRDGRLHTAVAAGGLPATLFVDAGGRVRYLHNGELDGAALRRYAAEHLGVDAP
jgi:thiol-disulfide isomerase/thioredoxin